MKNNIKNKIQKVRGSLTTLPVRQTGLLPNKLRTSRGFTLIEIMVAVTVFSLVMVVAIGAVLSMVSANKKAQAVNSVIVNLNFALEGMVRDIRTGYSYDCDPTTEGLQDADNGCTTHDIIEFHSIQTGDKVQYRVQGNAIYKVANGVTSNITGGNVSIDGTVSKIYIKDVGTAGEFNNYVQPKVILVIKGSFIGFGTPSDFYLQTMVSQRRLDI